MSPLILLPIALVVAVLPPLVAVLFFHIRDRGRKSTSILWISYALGLATPLPVLPVALPLYLLMLMIENPYVAGVLLAFCLAAIPEELAKFLALRFYTVRHRAFDEPMDGIIYGVAVGLGFATVENALYALGGLGTACLRTVTALPLHGFLGAIMGYYLAQARFQRFRTDSVVKALLVPMILHGLYDFPIFTLQRMGEQRDVAGPSAGTAIILVLLAIAVFVLLLVWVVVLVSHVRLTQSEAPTVEAVHVPTVLPLDLPVELVDDSDEPPPLWTIADDDPYRR